MSKFDTSEPVLRVQCMANKRNNAMNPWHTCENYIATFPRAGRVLL